MPLPRLSFLEFLDQDITQICKENNQFDAVYLLLYYYYGGCIYTALKEFGKALYFLEVAVTCPTAAVSHVMLEAYKKYLLVGLLVHGDKPKDSVMSLPKFTSPIVGKFLKPLCAAYSEIVRAYHVNAPEELRTVVTKYQVCAVLPSIIVHSRRKAGIFSFFCTGTVPVSLQKMFRLKFFR